MKNEEQNSITPQNSALNIADVSGSYIDTTIPYDRYNDRKHQICLSPRHINEKSVYGQRNGILGWWNNCH